MLTVKIHMYSERSIFTGNLVVKKIFTLNIQYFIYIFQVSDGLSVQSMGVRITSEDDVRMIRRGVDHWCATCADQKQ